MKVISLGWGIQSFTLAAMSALGELEPVDAAIFADTLHESALTYDFARRWTPWLQERGVRVVTVDNPMGGVWEVMKKKGQTHIPLFTLSEHGKSGQLRRSCTQRWKIAPKKKWLQANRNGEQVEQWLGITLDEFQRMKDSDVGYVTHRWPLIEKKMARQDCGQWLQDHGLETPPRSACTFCPFHNMDEWRRIRDNDADWQEATAVDEAMRNRRPGFRSYVHPARIPLADVDLQTLQDKGQLSLWDDECSGVCGI